MNVKAMRDDVCSDFFTGKLVVWKHKPRGGYGWTVLIPAKVLATTPKSVRLEIETSAGAVKTVWTAKRNVIENRDVYR